MGHLPGAMSEHLPPLLIRHDVSEMSAALTSTADRQDDFEARAFETEHHEGVDAATTIIHVHPSVDVLVTELEIA